MFIKHGLSSIRGASMRFRIACKSFWNALLLWGTSLKELYDPTGQYLDTVRHGLSDPLF